MKPPIVSVNITRQNENLLKLNPNLETTSHEKEVFFPFKDDDYVVALEYSREDALQNNVINPIGATHIWNEIFEKHWQLTGSSTDNIQNESVSASLLSLIHRITGSFYVQNSKNKLDENMYTPSLSLLQLIHFAQFAKDKIQELHTILLTMRHHLVFMSLCIAFSDIMSYIL